MCVQLSERESLIVESQSLKGFKQVAKYFFIAAGLFALWDVYTLIRHGHIIGGVFMAGICLLIAVIAWCAKARAIISDTSYRSEYRIAGIPLSLEYSFKQYPILKIEYDCLDSHSAIKHPVETQFFLLQRQFPTLQHAVSLSSDISFAKNADPHAVAQFIHKLEQASGLELSWGDGPKRDIYPAYQALIAK